MSENAFWLIQLLGGAGYAVLLLAPLMRTRRQFLAIDSAGLMPVGIHYLLLGAPAGAMMCFVYIVMNAGAALLAGGRLPPRVYWVFYPVAAGAIWLTATGWHDGLALAGTLFAVAARQQSSLVSLKFLTVLSALSWGAYGVFAPSVGQVVFSTFYALASALGGLRDLTDDRAAPGPLGRWLREVRERRRLPF